MVPQLSRWIDVARASLTGPADVRPALGALGVVGLLAAVHATAPAVFVNDMPFDLWVPIEAGWRQVSGQRPHIDYHTPIGWMFPALYGLAMQIGGASARVVLWVPAALSVVVAALALWVAAPRLSTTPLAAFVASLGLTALSPRHLDRDSLVHLASYNRVGWALTAVVLLALLVPRRSEPVAAEAGARAAAAAKAARDGDRRDTLEAVVLAVVIWSLLCLKVTYALLLGGAVVACGALLADQRRLVVGVAVGSAMMIGSWAATSPLAGPYLDDLRSAAASFDPRWAAFNAERVPGVAKMVQAAWFNAPALLTPVVALLWLSRTSSEAARASVERATLAVLAVLVGVIGITTQSHDHAAPALISVVAAIGVMLAGRAPDRAATLGAAWCAALMLVSAVPDALGVLAHRAAVSSGVPMAADGPLAEVRMAGDPMRPPRASWVVRGAVDPDTFRALVPSPTLGATDFELLLTAGSGVVDRFAGPDARVLPLMFASPLSWSRGTPPPTGVVAWFDPGRTFGGDRPLTAETLRDVDVVLDPRIIDLPVRNAMFEQLEPALRDGWVPHDTPLWRVWVRADPR
jgi:hypothetical protein